MNTKKRVIYDSKIYFSRFIKHEFRKTLKFDSFKNYNSFENRIKNYSIIIFVIYSEEELADFMKIYKTGIPLIVCTFNKILLLKIQNIDGILVLNISKIKSEILTEMKSCLNLVSFFIT